MDIVFFWIAVSLYAAASCCFFAGAVFKKEAWGKIGVISGTAGIIAHTLAIATRWADTGHGPYITIYEVLSADAFTAILLYLLLAVSFNRLRGIGILVFPFALLLMGLGSSSIDVRTEAPVTFRNWWLVIHISFAKLATAAILLSSVLSVFFLVKGKRPDVLKKLTSPEIEDLSYRFLVLGLLFQSMMIAAGAIWAHSSWGRFWGWDPIETWSFITWLSYGIVLHMRRLHGWRGSRGAYLTVTVFFITVFSAFVVVLVRQSVHSSYLVK